MWLLLPRHTATSTSSVTMAKSYGFAFACRCSCYSKFCSKVVERRSPGVPRVVVDLRFTFRPAFQPKQKQRYVDGVCIAPPSFTASPCVTNTLPRASIMEEVCRIGTLLYLAPMWRSIRIHLVRTQRMRCTLLSIVKTHLREWGQCRVILLWALAHAVRESQNVVERKEFALRLLMVSRQMGLCEWHDIRTSVESVLSWHGIVLTWQAVETAVQDALISGITK